MRPLLLLVLALVSAPLALAQEHDHGGDAGMAMVLHDGPPDGRAVVGGYTHFGFALLDAEGAPVPHQNAEFTLTQNGRVLFETTDTHEYDGILSFDMRFSSPGPYVVTATSGDMMLGTFEGVAVAPANATEATVLLETAAALPGSRAVAFALDIVGPDGATIEHTDAIVELREAGSGALFSRSHFHIHDAPIAFTQALGPASEYVAHVVAYDAFPTGRRADVLSVVAEFPVSAGPLAAPGLPAPDPTPPALLEQRGASATGGGMTLYATYDPNNQVGVGQVARIAGVVVNDSDRAPVAHVDLAFELTGPRGLVFSSASLHEYDGVFEHLFVPDAPGVYDGSLVAKKGDVELRVPIRLLVVPPVVPLGGPPGVGAIAVDGLADAVAGVPTDLTFTATSSGQPAAHSEVDVTIFHENEAPRAQFKLHTHGSGLTSARVTFPHEGDWSIRVDGLSTVPEPIVFLPTLVGFSVAPGSGVPAAIVDPAGEAKVPGAWGAIVILGLAGALLLARR